MAIAIVTKINNENTLPSSGSATSISPRVAAGKIKNVRIPCWQQQRELRNFITGRRRVSRKT
jgi:hypothetical protein